MSPAQNTYPRRRWRWLGSGIRIHLPGAAILATVLAAASLAGCVDDKGNESDSDPSDLGMLSKNAVGPAGMAIGEELKRAARVLRFPRPPASPLGPDYQLALSIEQTDPIARSLSLPQIPLCGSVAGPCTEQALSQTVTVPVRMNIEWLVEGHTEHTSGNPTGTFRNTLSPEKLDAGFVFRPIFVDADWPPPISQRTQERNIRLVVTFTADVPAVRPALNQAEKITYTIDRPIPVQIPELEIPTLAAMFVNTGFDPAPDTGPYILVRGYGPAACGELKDRLQKLDPAVSLLHTFVSVGTSFALADALPLVANALSTRSDRLRCRLAVSVANLAEDPLNPGGFLGWGNISAEDSISSLILIGAQDSQMTLFNDRGWDDHRRGTGTFKHNPAGGQLELTVGSQLAILIPTLWTPTENHPTAAPAFTPADATVEVVTDALSHQGSFGYDSFNDELSAVFFKSPGAILQLQR